MKLIVKLLFPSVNLIATRATSSLLVYSFAGTPRMSHCIVGNELQVKGVNFRNRAVNGSNSAFSARAHESLLPGKSGCPPRCLTTNLERQAKVGTGAMKAEGADT